MTRDEAFKDALFSIMFEPPSDTACARVLSTLRANGYAMVPVEPTEEMLSEGYSACKMYIGKPNDDDDVKHVWEWMLAAAQKEQNDGR